MLSLHSRVFLFWEEQAVLISITACKTQDLLPTYYLGPTTSAAANFHCFSPEKLNNTPSLVCCHSCRHNFARESLFLPIWSGKQYYSSCPIDQRKNQQKQSWIDGAIDDQMADINFFTFIWLSTFNRQYGCNIYISSTKQVAYPLYCFKKTHLQKRSNKKQCSIVKIVVFLWTRNLWLAFFQPSSTVDFKEPPIVLQVKSNAPALI